MSLQKNTGAVRRFAKAMRFGAWLQALPGKLTPPPFRLMQIGSAFWQSRALYVAVRLDIATQLGDAELSAANLAERVAAHADAVARLMRLLVAMGIFTEAAPHIYRNNKLSNHLRSDHRQNVRAMILMHNAEAMSRPWFEQLEQGIRSGMPPFRLSHGEELFDFLDHHADEDRLFSEAMDCVEALVGDSYARDVDWGRFTRIIDVGGSRGSKSLAILNQHPHLQALVVDRPQVVAEAQAYWAAHPVAGSERLSFQAGDLFGANLPIAAGECDVYLLSAVLHAFDDDKASQALRNLAAVIGHSGARIALMELVLPQTGADLAGASFDMQMFMGTRGRERTLSEWSELPRSAGLLLEEIIGLQQFGSVLVLRAP